MQSALWGKGGCQQSYQGVPVVVATAAATTGSLPRVTPRRKGDQEKKSLRGISKPALGRTFPSWEQRTSSTPLEPAPLPQSLAFCCLGGPRGIPWPFWEPKSISTWALGRNLWPGGHGRPCQRWRWWEKTTTQIETQSHKAKRVGQAPPLSPLFSLPPSPGHTSSPVLPLSVPQGSSLGAPWSVGH